MDLDLKLLGSFVVLAQEEHVGRAAALLYISQPALSKQLRKLEDYFGVPLVRKVGRRIELTHAGRLLAQEASEVLHRAEMAERRVRASVREERDEVVIAFVPPMPPQLTTDLLRECAEVLGCDVALRHVDWRDQVTVVAFGQADLSLVRGPVEGFTHLERLGYERLFAEPRLAAFAAAHPLAGAGPLNLADLEDEPIVATAPNTDFWTVNPRPDGRPPILGPRVTSVAEMLEVVAAGRAMALTAQSQSEFYSRPDIAYVAVRDVAPSEVLVVWPLDRLGAATQRVLEDLRRRAASLGA